MFTLSSLDCPDSVGEMGDRWRERLMGDVCVCWSVVLVCSGFVGIVGIIVGLSRSLHYFPSMITRCPGFRVMASLRVGLVGVTCPSVCSLGLTKVTFCLRINASGVSFLCFL